MSGVGVGWLRLTRRTHKAVLKASTAKPDSGQVDERVMGVLSGWVVPESMLFVLDRIA